MTIGRARTALSCAAGLALAAGLAGASAEQPALTQVYANNDFQLTGISVSKTGRLFVNFPRWSDRYLDAVVEVKPDGSTAPYPNVEWNRWNGKVATAGDHFVCVQTEVADGENHLWVVDAAAPMPGPIVPGGPKLVEIDLGTNRVMRTIVMPPGVVKSDSYLNDIRFDLPRHTGYMTDSGHAGIIVVDLRTGAAHRELDGDPSVNIAPGVQVVVGGKPVLKDGKPPQFKVDSIALSPDGSYLYYKPITAVELYRIKTSVLRGGASPATVSAAVEPYLKTFPTDGIWMTKTGYLYLSDPDHFAVSRITPQGKLERVVTDRRLRWPDTFTQNPDGGAIFISTSHIEESPPYNKGVSVRTTPYGVFKFEPPE